MANAKRCDKCEAFYEEYEKEFDGCKINGFLTVNMDYKRAYSAKKVYELCPACLKSFADFMEGKHDNP